MGAALVAGGGDDVDAEQGGGEHPGDREDAPDKPAAVAEFGKPERGGQTEGVGEKVDGASAGERLKNLRVDG